MKARQLARGLGWMSLGLGAAELLAPRRLTGMLRVRGDHRRLVRSYGLREIGSGMGLLLGSRPAPWLWARAAGDLIDLGTLRAARRASRRKAALNGAMAAIAAITAVDVAAAARMQGERI